MYYDRTYRKDGLHEETRKTVDVDFQHNFSWGPRNKFVWGFGYRKSEDHLVGNEYIWFSLESEKASLYSWFLQDEITLVPDKLRLTLGTKVEDNYFTGYEIQPNARVLWNPSEKQSVWTAVSRAARTPSRFELDCSRNEGVGYVTDEGIPVVYITTGNPSLVSEKLTAYELGYRIQPSDQLSIDAATFFNVYDDFRSYDAGIPYSVALPAQHIVQPLILNNSMNAKTYGLELSLNYRPKDNWRISAGYTGIKIKMAEDTGHVDPVQATYPQDTPRNQFNIRSYLDLPRHFELDTMIYYVGKLPHYRVPGYTRVDVRLGWRPTPKIEVSLGVRNLLDSHHVEFGRTYTELATEVERKFYAKVTRRF
jgi:iron complex outermembrane receptor protein